MEVGGPRNAPAALPPGKTRYPLYWRLGGPQGRFGRVWKISPTPGFDPRTVQPVANRYTDWTLPSHSQNSHLVYKTFIDFRSWNWLRSCNWKHRLSPTAHARNAYHQVTNHLDPGMLEVTSRYCSRPDSHQQATVVLMTTSHVSSPAINALRVAYW